MATFIAFIQAVPAIKLLVDQFVAIYVQFQIAAMKAEHRNAIKKAIEDQDQRELERAIKSPQAGEQTELPGTTIRDSLPNVMREQG